jgi:hypothetical protein
MSDFDKQRDETNARIKKEADDKATRWHLLFAGQATPEQAALVKEDLRRMTFAEECPAHSGQFDTNRTMHFTGRQAVWLEIEHILSNNPIQR